MRSYPAELNAVFLDYDSVAGSRQPLKYSIGNAN
jgi:hypothetical protein